MARARADARDARASDWRAFVAGVAGGASSTLALHPLDVVKTRLQVQDDPDARRARYAGAWRGARRIVAEEGARGIYAGAAPAMASPAKAAATRRIRASGAKGRMLQPTRPDPDPPASPSNLLLPNVLDNFDEARHNMSHARALTAVVVCSLALALQPSPATRLKTLCEERRARGPRHCSVGHTGRIIFVQPPAKLLTT